LLQLAFVNFRKDSYIVVEGKSDNDRFYIIQSGHVRCYHENEVPGSTPELLGPGDFVGVIPCMSGHFQIETVIAVTDVVCISVRRDQYPELIERNTPVAMKIIRKFANTMRTLNETLMQLTLNNTVIAGPEQIYSVASYYEKSAQPNIALYAYYQYLKTCPDGQLADKAKSRFTALRKTAKTIYLEPSPDLLRVYPKDSMIFSECQFGADMFIIQEGQVKISKVVNGNEVTLALLKKGDMFGEMALLENKPRSASAIAHENCRLMTVNRQNFDQMVATQPQLIARLTTMLADRLWSMYRQLINTQLREPLYKLVDMIALQIEKMKNTYVSGVSLQTDLTLIDVANMCGLAAEQQFSCFNQLLKDPYIKLVQNKIYISDCFELIKQAAFYRRQRR
jgi:CRP-like cAMP-binding protein